MIEVFIIKYKKLSHYHGSLTIKIRKLTNKLSRKVKKILTFLLVYGHFYFYFHFMIHVHVHLLDT